MPEETTGAGWRRLAGGWPWFRGEGAFPLPAYSEFTPPPRLVRRPYGTADADGFAADDPHGWPVGEYEEELELRPGMHLLARELVRGLADLARGKPAPALHAPLDDNPYWPAELAEHRGGFPHDRCVLLLPLALSRTLDDKSRPTWTVFGGSEHGPARAFWQGFATGPDRGWAADRAVGFLRRLLHTAYGETDEPEAAGLRVLPTGDGDESPAWDDGPLPAWAEPLRWSPGGSLRGVKYLLTFRPFARLPAPVRRAYREGRLHLLPFPGSLIFWGVRPYSRLREDLPLAHQIPLQTVLKRSDGPHRLRVPQAGWLHEPGPAGEGGKPRRHVRNTVRRVHRPAKEFQNGDGGVSNGEDKLAHALFSTRPGDIGLYNKPMARNAQLWGEDFRLLLDGPCASPHELEKACAALRAGGHFGYRFQYPAMRVGPFEVYWHRPLVACRAAGSDRVTVLDDAPLGYLTAYPADRPDPASPAAVLWPRLLRRGPHAEAVELFRHADEEADHPTMLNVRKLLTAHELLGEPLPRSFARRLLTLDQKQTLDGWLAELPAKASVAARGESLADELRHRIAAVPTPQPTRPPESLTFARTARRSFEVAFWKAVARLSAGGFVTKNNGDPTAGSPKPRRDLDRVTEFLLSRHRRAVEKAGMTGRAAVGEHVFRWETEWPYPWLGGWKDNQSGARRERNVFVLIPGRDRSRAVVVVDHYDTAYRQDVYERDESRLPAPGADDNGSATATLLLAAPVLLELSRAGRLGCDVWLVHLTGEEFPADGLGGRRLCRDLVQGTLRLQLPGDREADLSGVRVGGVFVLDMVAHRRRGRDVFQISPGVGRESLALARHAHEANEAWNASVPFWNCRPGRRGRPRRSKDPARVPPPARFPQVVGEVRPECDPRSTLYNADSQTFSDAGVPVVLLMEDYDPDREGYHDSEDTAGNVDLDYGRALAAIAIESAARAACDPA